MKEKTTLTKEEFCRLHPQYIALVEKWLEGEYWFDENRCAIGVKHILMHKLLLSDTEGAITLLNDKQKRDLGSFMLKSMIKVMYLTLKEWEKVA